MLYRQGDLLLVKIEETEDVVAPELDKDNNTLPVKDGNLVLLEGETVGHYHGVSVEDAAFVPVDRLGVSLADEGTWRLVPFTRDFGGCQIGVLDVWKDTKVVHVGHHDPLDLPVGKYRVVRQREYQPGPVKQSFVMD